MAGFVDAITRNQIVGWAVDSNHPDATAEVVICLDGRKIAHINCDLLREDLARLGKFGDGRHGFRFTFVPPLEEDREIRVSVRDRRTGAQLERGEGLLRSSAQSAIVTGPLPLKNGRLVIPAPDNPRALFRAFRLYDAGAGLYPLLCRLDFNGATLRDMHYAVHEEGKPHSDDDIVEPHVVRDRLHDMLHSDRFQKDVLTRVLRAFPEKRRIVFVHIPKCAGSDLRMNLSYRFPELGEELANRAQTPCHVLFESLAEFVRELEFSEELLVHGHLPLSYYTSNELIRPSDRIFTIVRDPIDIAISYINYVLTRIHRNAVDGRLERDVEDWLSILGMTALPAAVTPEFVREHVSTLLHSENVVVPNSMCYWLGGGTVGEVVDRLAFYDVEITDTIRYGCWLKCRWDISPNTRHNESIKFVSKETIGHAEIDYLHDVQAEDRKLFGMIQRALARIGNNFSISGGDLAGMHAPVPP
jgi:hypothetical protein